MASLFGGSKKKEESKEEVKGQPQDEPKEEEKKAGGVMTMKRGDYMIHVLVEQAKSLLVEPGETVDPIVEINCLGTKKYTSAQKGIDNTGVAMWNEHVFFEPKNKEAADMESGKIEIKLLDKGFLKDVIIGYYEFDLSYIYLSNDHALMHKWIVMSNPDSDNFGEVTGYLKLSITISGESDPQVQISEDPNPDVDDIIQPPSVRPEFYQLYIRFFTSQKIVPMDAKTLGFGQNKIDAYVSLKYKTKTLKTKVLLQPEDGSISWNQQFLVPAQIPVMGGKLPFKVWDEDLTGDEQVGAFELNAKDIIGKKNGIFFWKNIYGAPMGFSNDAAENMNNNPAMASFWKGRILMQVEAVKTEKPLLMVEDIDPELIEKARPHLLDKKYQIMVQINSAVSLPQPMTDYEVVVRVGEHEIRTGNPPFKKERYNRFNFRTTAPGGKDSNPEKDKQVTFNAPYLNIDDIGTVFVYLRGKTLL